LFMSKVRLCMVMGITVMAGVSILVNFAINTEIN
jgi:hypothetical protein